MPALTPEQRKENRKSRREERRKRSQSPAQKAPPVNEQVKKAEIKISDTMLAIARSRNKVSGDWAKPDQIFAAQKPPQGVVPAGMPTMAQDSDIGSISQWATNWFQSAVMEGVTFIGYPLLSELATRAEYRVISETISTEMTREGIELKATSDEEQLSDKLEQLTAFLDDLNMMDAFRKAALMDGFFGRSHMYLDTGDSDDSDELKIPIGDGRDILSQVKVSPDKKLRGLKVIEPVWTYPTSYNSNDPLKDNWYRPDAWFVMGKQIHRTRLLTFVGREVPDLLKPAYSFGGLSMSQMAKPYVDNWLRTRQSVADLIHSFVVWVLKTNLSTMSQNDGAELFKRLDMFNLLRDNQGVMALDKDTEEFQNVQTSLSTLDALQAQTQEHVAAVSRIPLVKLLGISPAGLNATAEPEIRVFYDTIHAQQEHLFRTPITSVIGFAQLSLWGKVDPRITFDFKPLWALDEKERAEVKKIQADTAATMIDSGVLATDEERERVAKDPDSDYPGLDLNREIAPPGGIEDEANGEHEDVMGGLNDIIEGREPGEGASEKSGGPDATSVEKPKVKEAA